MENPNSLKPVAPGGCENHTTSQTYYTVAEVAARYGVSSRVIYEALNRGAIHGIRIGGWRIREEDLQAFEKAGGFGRNSRGAAAKVNAPIKTQSRGRRRRPLVTRVT